MPSTGSVPVQHRAGPHLAPGHSPSSTGPIFALRIVFSLFLYSALASSTWSCSPDEALFFMLSLASVLIPICSCVSTKLQLYECACNQSGSQRSIEFWNYKLYLLSLHSRDLPLRLQLRKQASQLSRSSSNSNHDRWTSGCRDLRQLCNRPTSFSHKISWLSSLTSNWFPSANSVALFRLVPDDFSFVRYGIFILINKLFISGRLLFFDLSLISSNTSIFSFSTSSSSPEFKDLSKPSISSPLLLFHQWSSH